MRFRANVDAISKKKKKEGEKFLAVEIFFKTGKNDSLFGPVIVGDLIWGWGDG